MRTRSNSETGSRHPNRQGITLLFVVSMIVLFLLMGTAFMIVSNDYYKASRNRGKKHTFSVNNKALVHQAFYELIRGPELANPASPLRAQDILSDMYGYGFKAKIDGNPTEAPIPGTLNWTTPRSASDHFIELQLKNGATPNAGLNLLTGAPANLSSNTGQYNGNVISFVSGPAKGVSTRIMDYRVTGAAPNEIHRFIIAIPSRIDRGSFALADLADSDVIVNGRAFGGYGAGGFDPSATPATAALGVTALEPNRVGESLADLIAPGGYLSFGTSTTGNPEAPNESYDGPDYQNMYLSGYDSAGNLIASFYRPSLKSRRGDANAGGPGNRHMFSAFDLDSGGGVELEVDTDLNGEMDAFWMDIGLAIQTTSDGLRYKPLVAYRVVDQDGLVNLNVAGNVGDLLDTSSAGNVRGQGYGPAELSVKSFLGGADYQNIIQGSSALPGRYGVDQQSGGAARDAWSLEKLFGYPTSTATGGFFASSAHNIAGRFPVNRPTVTPYVDLNDTAFNNTMPQLDFANYVAANDTMVNSPYEANFAPSYLRGWEADDDDELFTPLELERMLRVNDIDANLLPGRLVALAAGVAADTTKRMSVTTESYEVPMAPALVHNGAGKLVKLTDRIRSKLGGGGINGTAQDDLVREYLSHELLVGMKMDVNRVFGNGADNNNNRVVDDPVETNELNVDQAGNPAMDLDNDFRPGTNDQLARYKFAKQLYILLLLTTEDSKLSFANLSEYRTAVAQWCVNVVDFRDPDSIHTPFEFDLNPWDGWDVDGIVQAGETNQPLGRHLVWGAERPELLLTESIATHDRRTEDLPNDVGDADVFDDGNGRDNDFDSRLIPQTSVYLEVYNPWTQDNVNQILPAELGDGTSAVTNGVDLQRTAPSGAPVWRIRFVRPEDIDGNSIVNRVDAENMNIAQGDGDIVRSVVFTTAAPPAAINDGGAETFFTTVNTDIPLVAPGSYAVIGSAGNVPASGGEYRSTFGRLSTSTPGNLMLDDTRSISLVPSMNVNNNQILRNEWDGTQMTKTGYKGIAVVIDSPRSLSVSDPNGGYNITGAQTGDGHALPAIRDKPIDASGRNAFDEAAIWTNGTTDDFRVVELQRLANPLVAWHQDTNPYLTIDTASLDLVAFNGMQNDPNNDNAPAALRDPNVVNSTAATDFGTIERGENQGANAKMLFRRDFGDVGQNGNQVSAGSHNFGFEFQETLGRVNTDYLASANNFAWLTWNNRPFVSHLELTNVPASTPEHLTRDFTTRNTSTDPYTAAIGGNAMRSKFGHLLNFYGADDTSSTPTLGNFHRLLDFLEVPSRYVGTEQWLSPMTFPNNPFNFVSHYRYPGKINLNTIPNQQVYDVLMGGYATGSGSLAYNDFNDSRWRDDGDPATDDFFRPYRNSTEGNLVALGISAVDENVDCGLLRRGGTPANPLFESNSPRDAYFQNAMRQRLGNLATTRSSVFAIWVTVGYFEVDENDILKDGATGGAEVGADTGGAIRNRGFFIFDRSIPVAYEPGKNHNIERAILVQSIIE